MPAIKLFGRRWLAASDDLVFPCIFETVWRIIFLAFTSFASYRYWQFLEHDVIIDNFANLTTFSSNTSTLLVPCHFLDVALVRTYLIGVNAIVALNFPLLVALIYHSARGSVSDVKARQLVAPLMYLKIFVCIPESAIHVLGTCWMFCDTISCYNMDDNVSHMIFEASIIFYWIVFGLKIFGFIVIYDPMGARKYRKILDSNDNIDPKEHHMIMHQKLTKLWLRRFKFAFCCLTKDEYGDEALTQSAELFSHLFRGIDLTPTDVIAGAILLRVREKKENREIRRIQTLNDICPRFTTDLSLVFTSQCPSWMTLRNAQHFLKFAISSYGWQMVCALSPCTGLVGVLRRVACCAKLRKKKRNFTIEDDNCCHCNIAGARYTSKIHSDDVIYASFRNKIYEIPFCLLADNSTKNVVLSIRGSWSVSDIFTDLSAAPAKFSAPGMPEDTFAHHGMSICVEKLYTRLIDENLLEQAMSLYSDYDLVVTGHSLGAGLAVLIGAKLRQHYPNLKVFAFETPNGVLSRNAIKITEQFAFTLVIGDDFIPRLSIDAVENLRTGILETLQSCKLPKYRVFMYGLSYALRGIPTDDLDKHWYDVNELAATTDSSNYSTLVDQRTVATIEHHAYGLNPTLSEPRKRLHVAGRILHIVKRKNDSDNKRSGSYEMRWAAPEDFLEIKVMPRMMLDHFPNNINGALSKILKEQRINTKVTEES